VRESCALEAGTLSIETPLHELGQQAEWQRLLRLADPDGTLTAEERDDAARRLRREKLIAAGRRGAQTYQRRAEIQRAFADEYDSLLADVEALAGRLRTLADIA
jgi:hypothetical protein